MNTLINFLADCIRTASFDEQQAKNVLAELGIKIDVEKSHNRDTTALQHGHDVLLNLISEQ